MKFEAQKYGYFLNYQAKMEYFITTSFKLLKI